MDEKIKMLIHLKCIKKSKCTELFTKDAHLNFFYNNEFIKILILGILNR